MPEKHYVFSARTTQQGLAALNELKVKLGVGWDELVIEAVCGHYGLDRSALTLPKAEAEAKPEVADEAGAKAEAKKNPKAKKADPEAASAAAES